MEVLQKEVNRSNYEVLDSKDADTYTKVEATISNCLSSLFMSPCESNKVNKFTGCSFAWKNKIVTVGYGIHFILQMGHQLCDTIASMDP